MSMPHSEQEGASSVVKRVRADAAMAFGSTGAGVPPKTAGAGMVAAAEPCVPSNESSSAGGFSFK